MGGSGGESVSPRAPSRVERRASIPPASIPTVALPSRVEPPPARPLPEEHEHRAELIIRLGVRPPVVFASGAERAPTAGSRIRPAGVLVALRIPADRHRLPRRDPQVDVLDPRRHQRTRTPAGT